MVVTALVAFNWPCHPYHLECLFLLLENVQEQAKEKEPNHLSMDITISKWNPNQSAHKNYNPAILIKQNSKLDAQEETKVNSPEKTCLEDKYKFHRNHSILQKDTPEKACHKRLS